MGGIIWIIIIIWIVVSISNKNKGKKPGKQGLKKPVQSSQQKAAGSKQSGGSNDWYNEREKQQDLKARLSQKYNRQKPKGDILQRAKASVAEDFTESEALNNMVKSENASSSATQSRQQEIKRRAEEKLAAENLMSAPGESDVLKMVEELMVKGPNMDIAFERDFVAEGVDMLNRIQA